MKKDPEVTHCFRNQCLRIFVTTRCFNAKQKHVFRSRFQRHNPLASTRLPGEEAAAEVGGGVWHAVDARHGGRVHPFLRAAVHHGPLPVPHTVGYPHRDLVVHSHLRQSRVLGDAQRFGKVFIFVLIPPYVVKLILACIYSMQRLSVP